MRRFALALAALALIPSAADAKFHFRSLGVATRWAESDGVRYAVFPTKHALVLVDAGSTKLKIKRLPLRNCPLAGGPPYYYVVGGGQIAVGCAYELFLRGFSGGKMVHPPYIDRPGGYFDAVENGSEGDEAHARSRQALARSRRLDRGRQRLPPLPQLAHGRVDERFNVAKRDREPRRPRAVPAALCATAARGAANLRGTLRLL
jgi:hypothetical protein